MFVTATQGRRRKERKNKTSQGYAFTNKFKHHLSDARRGVKRKQIRL